MGTYKPPRSNRRIKAKNPAASLGSRQAARAAGRPGGRPPGRQAALEGGLPLALTRAGARCEFGLAAGAPGPHAAVEAAAPPMPPCGVPARFVVMEDIETDNPPKAGQLNRLQCKVMIVLVICSAPLLVSALGMVESAHLFLFETYQMRVLLCDGFFMVFTWPLF